MITGRFEAAIVAGGTPLKGHMTSLRYIGEVSCTLEAALPGTPFTVTLEFQKSNKISETDFLASLFIDGNLIETVPVRRDFVGTVTFEGKSNGSLIAPFIFTKLDQSKVVEIHHSRKGIIDSANHNLGRIELIVKTVILVEEKKRRQRGESKEEVREVKEVVTESGVQYQQTTGSIYSEPPLTINQYDREWLQNPLNHSPSTCITRFRTLQVPRFPSENSISNFRQVSAHEQKQVCDFIFEYRWKCRWFQVDIDAASKK